MQVSTIMSTPVVTVSIEERLRDAVAAMLEHGVGSVVVLDPHHRGIVTRSDALRWTYDTGKPLADIPVRDVAHDDLVTITPETTVDQALRTMAEHNIKKLPVIDSLELCGIVTMTDIAEHLPDRVQETRRVLDRRDEWTT